MSDQPDHIPEIPQPIVQPIIDELKQPHKGKKEEEKGPPVGPIHPPKPAELDQDPGGGYNPSHTIPQP